MRNWETKKKTKQISGREKKRSTSANGDGSLQSSYKLCNANHQSSGDPLSRSRYTFKICIYFTYVHIVCRTKMYIFVFMWYNIIWFVQVVLCWDHRRPRPIVLDLDSIDSRVHFRKPDLRLLGFLERERKILCRDKNEEN